MTPHDTTAPTRQTLAARPLRRAAIVGVALLAAMTFAACGSSSPSSNSTTTAATGTTYPADKQEVCQARDQLQTSVTALTDPSLLTKGTTAITSAVDQVKTDLANLKTAAKQDYQPQVQALQTSIDDLQTAAGNLGNGSVGANLTAVGTAITSVNTNASALLTELKTSCG